MGAADASEVGATDEMGMTTRSQWRQGSEPRGDTVMDLGSTTAVTLSPNPRTRWERPLLNDSNHAPAHRGPSRVRIDDERQPPGPALPSRIPPASPLVGRSAPPCWAPRHSRRLARRVSGDPRPPVTWPTYS